MNELKVYISGPISAPSREEQQKNIEVFHTAEKVLRDQVNPGLICNPLRVGACLDNSCDGTENGHPVTGEYVHSWDCYLRYDLIAMLECNTILLLPSWTSSKGATLEYDVADALGFRVLHFGLSTLKIFKERGEIFV
jgi:hypothetical protein